MVISPVNNVQFYSYIKSTGYFNGIGQNGQVRPDFASNSSSVEPDLKKNAAEKIGAGTDLSLKTRGVYIDVLHPQYTRESPVSRARGSFKTVLESVTNSPENNARVYSNPAARKSALSESPKFELDSTIHDSGFVITVPGEHLNKLNENRSNSLSNKLYDIYNNNKYSYSGSLVNVTV